jgi:hypothetical protein
MPGRLRNPEKYTVRCSEYFPRPLSGARFSTDTGDAKASAARWMREAGDQTGKLLEKPLRFENLCIFGASC